LPTALTIPLRSGGAGRESGQQRHPGDIGWRPRMRSAVEKPCPCHQAREVWSGIVRGISSRGRAQGGSDADSSPSATLRTDGRARHGQGGCLGTAQRNPSLPTKSTLPRRIQLPSATTRSPRCSSPVSSIPGGLCPPRDRLLHVVPSRDERVTARSELSHLGVESAGRSSCPCQ